MSASFMSPRYERYVSFAGSAVALVMLGAVSLRAQSSTEVRDSIRAANRVYRLQLRHGDTSYVRSIRAARVQLEERLDSLQHEFEGLGLDAPDRADLVRELRALITSLANLSQLEQVRAGTLDHASGALDRAAGPIQRARVQALTESEAFPRIRTAIASLQPGWIGINAEAPHTRVVRDDSAYVRYFNYPEVVSVEPNSPAERAGIARGDQLVAYDGLNLRDREINLTRLLQPSRRLHVTVRRDGDERDFSLVVTRPPQRVMGRLWGSIPDVIVDSVPNVVVVVPRVASSVPRFRSGGGGGVLFDRLDPESAPIAGAKLTEIRNDDLGHIFGVSSGVLVTEVFADPSRSSGLRGGDVILRADGDNLTSVAQLRRIVAAHAADRVVDLEIVRQKRARTLTLRW
jgi:S1-C subfamily serine protease